MQEKRQFQRYECSIKTTFDYYEGNPDTIDIDISVPLKGKGFILDVSQGGAFVITDTLVPVNMPIRIYFKTKKNKHEISGYIVRTGTMKNNPSEVAQKYLKFASKGEAYIAVKFDDTLTVDITSELV